MSFAIICLTGQIVCIFLFIQQHLELTSLVQGVIN